jgi:DNA-binding MarR family transcriptional regulator
MHDHPRTVRLPETDSHAHPSAVFLAFWPCTAAVEEIVAEGHVILRGDVQVVDLESRRPRTQGKTGFPVLLVCRCSSELQRGDRIERHHVRRVMGQRAARALARRFDAALRPVGLTSGQFSLLMSLNRAEPPTMGQVSALLAMDRTTLTANLKPLERRELVSVTVDAADRRARRMRLTPAGRTVLATAVPIWEATHAEAERRLGESSPDRLRADLRALSSPGIAMTTSGTAALRERSGD